MLKTLAHASVLLFVGLSLSFCGGEEDAQRPNNGDAPGTDQDPSSGGIVSPSDPDSPFQPVPPNPNNHAPELKHIGNKRVPLGKSLVIELEGSDEDGDGLRYAVYGNVPEGASFDKLEGVFTWTPTLAIPPFSLTFAVSDGLLTVRETVTIEVLDGENSSSPPAFLPVGDQSLQVGVAFSLRLRATDPDGDRVTYDHEGRLPSGATLDKDSGNFAWTPDASFMGEVVRIIFIAEDATTSSKMQVKFAVSGGDAGGGGQYPPHFSAPSAIHVRVGERASVPLQAESRDGTPLSFGILNERELEGQAKIEGDKLVFTALQSWEGRSLSVQLAASTELFTSTAVLRVTILSGSQGPCVPDAFEPNNSLDKAHEIQGQDFSMEANICQTGAELDFDVYKLTLQGGERLDLLMWHGNGPVTLSFGIFSEDGRLLSGSDLASAGSLLSYEASSRETLYLWVLSDPYFPVPTELHGLNYGLDGEIVRGDSGGLCVDDAYAGNQSLMTAYALGDVEYLGEGLWDVEALALCEEKADYWSFPMACGGEYIVTVRDFYQSEVDGTASSGGRLQLSWYEGANQRSPSGLHQVERGRELELTIEDIARSGRAFLEVKKRPSVRASRVPYGLDVMSMELGCQAGSLDPWAGISGNHTIDDALDFYFLEGSFSAVRLCCESDFYYFEAHEGAPVRIWADISSEANFQIQPSLSMTVYDFDGTQLESIGKDINSSYLYFMPEEDDLYLLEVKGRPFTDYELHWIIEEGGQACERTSCGEGRVCDPESGHCVSDLCWTNSDCPSGYACPSFSCTYECENNGECKAGQVCESFAGSSWCVAPSF